MMSSWLRLASLLTLFCASRAIAQTCEYPIADLRSCIARTPRVPHVPTVNGCGPEGSTLKFPQGYGKASYRQACDAHDICYETCNSNKSACDDDLDTATESECLRAYPLTPPGSEDESWDRRAVCLSRGKAYANAVRNLGQPAYDAAQKLACECCLVPRTYQGTLRFHFKIGGPSTGILPYEYRVQANAILTRSTSSASYDIAGSATLLEFSKDTDANCHCIAENVSGTVTADTNALTLSNGVVSGFGWTSAFTVQMRCTGSNDPSCTNQQPLPILTVWSLSDLLPGCTGSSQVAFMNPRQLVGSTVLTCPATPQLVGRIEEASWTLQGTD